jgi:hypothetical protein
MVVFLPKLAEKSLGRVLSMTFAVTTDGGKRLYMGVPDSRDFYVSPSEDDGTAPGAYSTTDLSSDDHTARHDSSSRETGAYLAPLHLPDFYAAKGLNCPLDIDDEEFSTSAFSSVVGSDEEDGSDEDDMDEADNGASYVSSYHHFFSERKMFGHSDHWSFIVHMYLEPIHSS